MGVIRVLAATGRAIVGWAVGVAIGLGAGATVAWIANTWNSYRWGVPIGLLAFVIMFWGLVGGIFLIGPALAVWAARRRPGHLLSGEDGQNRFTHPGSRRASAGTQEPSSSSARSASWLRRGWSASAAVSAGPRAEGSRRTRLKGPAT
jgi:hypothetical protein